MSINALVIDDDEDSRASVSMHLQDFGVSVHAPSRTYATVGELVEFAISEAPDVTILDHRLQTRHLAPFFGAEAVAALVQSSKIAVLMTSYVDTDFDTSIRLYRQHIPVLLGRDELEEPESLDRMIEVVRNEIDGVFLPERKLRPTVVRVGDVVNASKPDQFAIDVFIPNWNPDRAVRIPGQLLAEDVRSRGEELIDQYLLAQVNVAEPRAENLYFSEVSGPVDPGEWPVSEVGTGASFPPRDKS
ncbi:MAG: hypothetical protein JWR52_1171 [Marmoricola sp.]|nr:hypothetical protein [Marmoricola sp.]